MVSKTSYFTSDMVGVVTGASSGIGAGTAVKLAQLGLGRMCITGRNTQALINTKQQCIKAAATAGNNMKESDIVIVSGDLTEETTIRAIFDATLKSFGRIDILINNAGILTIGLTQNTSIGVFDKVMDINVRSVVTLTQLFIPELKKTKGTIVNVSSIAGLRSGAKVGFYCMSKACLDMFTQCLALELAPYDVRVNSVNPGVVVTEIHKRTGMSDETYEKYIKKIAKGHPLGRVGNVEEVADAIAFLASPKNSFMTGNLTSIDGGRNLLYPG